MDVPSGFKKDSRDNLIHETATVSGFTLMGYHNYIGPHCFLTGDVCIGSWNRFEAFASIGTPAEHKKIQSKGIVRIGDSNKIREFVTINAALEGETFVGDECYIMTKAHVGHDAYIESEATLSSGAIVGGHSVVMRGANIGLGSVIHQNRVIGQFSMLGMNSTASRSIPPYVVAFGSPARAHRVNRVGLQRNNFDPEMISHIEDWFQMQLNPGDLVANHLVAEQVKRWQQRVDKLGGK